MAYRKRSMKKRRFLRRKNRGNKYRPKSYNKYNKPSKVFSRTAYVPDESFMKFSYTDNIQVVSSTGVPQITYYAGNSLFDPDITGVGHQPLGYDQWSAFYSKYCVYGSKISVTVLNASGTTAGTQNVECVLLPISSNVSTSVISAMTDIEEMYEYPYCSMRAGNIVGGAPNLRLKGYMSTAKIDGVPKLKIPIDNAYSALIAANPANLWRWVIGLQSSDESDTVTTRLLIKVTYYAKMYARNVIAQS